MKKVLFVATVVKLHIMVFHLPYLEWFKKNGYEVHVAARNDYENANECKIPFCDKFYDLPFERLPFNKNNVHVQRELKKIIDGNKYELVHCHTPMGGAIGRLAAREARKNGTKVFYTAHGFHFFKGASLINWLIYYPIERWLARFTDVLITINKEDYNRAKTFKASRVEYVPGVGININKFKKTTIDREVKRKSLGVEENEFMILSVGELNKNKNHRVIIRALAELRNKNVKYFLCGQGPLEDDLKRLAQEVDVGSQVKLLGFRKDIPELCNAADLFAFPSYREGLSLSLMEAMASGLPVICSCIRGNKDLIDNELGGYLLDPDKYNAFSTTIDFIMANVLARQKMGSYNKNKIDLFQIEKVIDQVSEIYKTTIKGGC